MDFPIIYDSHCHIFPHKIAEKASDAIGAFYELKMHETGSAEELFKAAKEAGIAKCLVCSTATKAEQVKSINLFIHDTVREYKGFFVGFGTLHQDMELSDSIGEIDLMIERGLHGIKLHPDFQKLNIDERVMYPVYEYIAEKGLPILIHMGDARYDYSSPERLVRVMRDIPKLRVIAAHLGGYQAWDRALVLSEFENISYDCSSSLAFLSRERAVSQMRHFGIDRVMFGSDFPMWVPADEIKCVLSLGLTDSELEALFKTNFERYILALEK